MKGKLTAIGLGACIIALSLVLPVPEGLTAAGIRGLGVLVAVIILYVTNALPLVVTTLMGMVLLPLLGVIPVSEIWPAFGNSAIFFMLASFGISAALGNTHIPQAIALYMIRWSKGRSSRLIAGFMSGTAFVSAFISDIPTCVMFGALVLELLRASRLDKPGESSLGRALMIAVPAGSIIGGFATPAGNGLNVLVMETVADIAGVSLTFAQWSLVGVPLCILMVAFCSWWLYRISKPDNLALDVVDVVSKNLEPQAHLGIIDIKFIIILFMLCIFWIASSWISAINIAVVSIVGVFVMHLPGINLLCGKDFVDNVSWETFIMCGGIIAIGVGVQQTGAIEWMVSLALTSADSWPPILVLLIFSVIGCVVHFLTPAAGAIYALTCIPLVTAAVYLGLDPITVALITGVWICITFIQPVDLVYLLTYSYEYYSMKYLLKFGVLPTAVLIVLTITWIPFACTLF